MVTRTKPDLGAGATRTGVGAHRTGAADAVQGPRSARRAGAYFLTLTTTVLAWTSWKAWRVGLFAAV